MITVIDPGFYTSIQDSGRLGYRHLGVPVAGPMDPAAFTVANALLPLRNNQTVIEGTLIGPTLQISTPLRFVVTGAKVPVILNDQPLKMNRVYTAPAKSILSIGKVEKGMRFYLRMEAFFDLPTYFDSVSFYAPLGSPARLVKGEVLQFMPSPKHINVPQNASLNVDASYLSQHELVVTPGPDWDMLKEVEQQQLINASHRIISHNRMGYRLSGTLNVIKPQLLSQLVIPGMVQLSPSGELLIAMADCQVTGGYLQVLQLTPAAIAVLAQKREGELLTFQSTLLQMAP